MPKRGKFNSVPIAVQWEGKQPSHAGQILLDSLIGSLPIFKVLLSLFICTITITGPHNTAQGKPLGAPSSTAEAEALGWQGGVETCALLLLWLCPSIAVDSDMAQLQDVITEQYVHVLCGQIGR